MSVMTRLLGTATLLIASAQALAQPLTLNTYNPLDAAVFPVSSTLISGNKDAILVDAQFSTKEANELIALVKSSGKNLTTIFISAGDPDFYFGLEALTQAFPNAEVLATPATVAYIEKTRAPKLEYWAPILKDTAPKTTLVPKALKGNTLTLEGQKIEVVGSNPEQTSLWIPSIGALVGGVQVSANIHLWLADAQTPEARAEWIKALDQFAALKPKTVVPGHYLGEPAKNADDLRFTREYLVAVEQELPKAKNSAELIKAMKARYPNLLDDSSLEMSAKVLKGEMKWP